MLRFFSPTSCRLSPFFVSPSHSPHLSRSIIVIQAIHASLQPGAPTLYVLLGLRKRSCFFEGWETGTRGKVNWLKRYFCWLEPSLTVTLISVISASATDFWLHPGTAERPPYFTCSQLHYLIGYMQIGPKLKATCEGSPRGIVYAHKHTHKLTSQYVSSSWIISAILGKAQHLPGDPHFHSVRFFAGCKNRFFPRNQAFVIRYQSAKSPDQIKPDLLSILWLHCFLRAGKLSLLRNQMFSMGFITVYKVPWTSYHAVKGQRREATALKIYIMVKYKITAEVWEFVFNYFVRTLLVTILSPSSKSISPIWQRLSARPLSSQCWRPAVILEIPPLS